jgi:phage tail sheath protein FI
MPIQGVGTAVAAFVGYTAARPATGAYAIQVSSWTAFISKFGRYADGRYNPFVKGAYLPYAVYGFFQNGGGICYVASVGTPSAPKQLGPGEQAQPQPARASLTAADDSVAMIVEATGKQPDKPLSVDVADDASDGDAFTLTVRAGDDVLGEYPGLSVTSLKTPAGLQALTGAAVTVTNVTARPKNGHYELAVPAATATADGAPSAADYLGSNDGSGLTSIASIDEVTMLAAPDAVASGDKELLKTVQSTMVEQCELLRDRVAILDPPKGLDVQAVTEWRENDLGASPFAALYYPWIQIYDPDANGPLLVPPSGHIAGVWNRSDDTRGVWKAPANEELSGALGLERQVSDVEQGGLNDAGVNAIRAFRGRGIRVWGARTLNAEDWRYINVRRLFNYVEESIKDGTAWVVFEPNEEQLWQRIRRTISAFLIGLWRDGALVGAKPELAFYVKCDEETNPEDLQDKGIVTIEVGIAPAKPAEFVVFKIQQLKGGSALVGE